jgi:hypothetical protein
VNDLTGLAQFTNSCSPGSSSGCTLQTVDGRAIGLELLLRRPFTRRLTAWVAYTLSRTERDNFDGGTGRWTRRLSEFDRTHVLNVAGAVDLGAGWRAGARFVGYSGLPYSTTSIDGPPDARAPPFFRLDLRLEKRWRPKWGSIALVAEWLNVLLSKENIGTTCTVGLGGASQCVPQAIGPITFPSLGVEAAF